ncbi:HsdM family class I SAM-dependent methyltransferase [Polaribacter porphyrae]|uniref:site-specific DNA-methyltransferase (adenine-specific) n=1 Tax=Polaribacter porphyrae TaxID=1137780 RepID=A0A2S7WRL8_9FLAO|nr:N-6 DNA methylase [Polaribacter porphyrae]PQJ80248.1 endonuclease [Polaribacter porphyrae]
MINSIIDNLDIIDFAKKSKDFDIDIFDNKKYGIVEVYGNENQPALFLKEVDSFDGNTLKLIADIHKDCWNFQKVLFLYVYTKTEIRIYNCSKKPFGYNQDDVNFNFKKELQNLELFSCNKTDKSKLETLNTLFSRIAIDTGFIWSAIEAEEIRKELNLQHRVDKFLVKSLINVAEKLEKEGLKDKDIIHKLIMRSLFLLYLEDKGATDKEFYNYFSDKATTYFDILKDPKATYNLFERLADDFNGSLFTITETEKDLVKSNHLELIEKCFKNGYVDDNQIFLFEDWRLFDFKIIRIELLSEIYENFLSKLDKKGKKDTGTFYTPPSLVELILNEKLPIQNNETDYNIKTLDPSCGSGIFLVQTFKRLVKRYEKHHNIKNLTDFNILVDILKKNIFGIEIDDKSIKVAAFSLYLSLLDNLDPKTDWWNKKIQFPYLINDPKNKDKKTQGYNLFIRDTISDFEIEELQNFQLIVGNPPFGKLISPEKDIENKQKNIREYCNKEKFAKEMVLPFLHKATFLAPKGEIALIFNTKVLTNTGGTYQNFRSWLFSKNYIEKIYNLSILRKIPKEFGGQLFGSATTPVSIIFYQNEKPIKPKDSIIYYAPKTYIKNSVLEGIVIDATDEKYLPRIECEKKDSKIWKIAMWGSYSDFELMEKINSKYSSLEEYFKSNKNEWIKATGLNADSKNLNFTPKKIILTQKISRFFSKKAIFKNSKKFRSIDEKYFKPPFIIIKQAQENKEICASYFQEKAFCLSSAYVINGNSDINLKKSLTALINSKITKYYLFLIASSWGIERERASFKELLSVPYLIDNLVSNKISLKVNKIISIKNSNEVNQDITHLEKEIDQIIYNDILKLSKDEQIVINDTINYSLDLFENQKKSDAVKPVLEVNHFTNRITNYLNNWLDDVNLKVSATHYKIDRNCPLYLVKISFGNKQKRTITSTDDVSKILKSLDKKLWEEEAQNLYFRKNLNYYDVDDVYIIKPNQRRFWSETAAMIESKTLLIEIMKGNE